MPGALMAIVALAGCSALPSSLADVETSGRQRIVFDLEPESPGLVLVSDEPQGCIAEVGYPGLAGPAAALFRYDVSSQDFDLDHRTPLVQANAGNTVMPLSPPATGDPSTTFWVDVDAAGTLLAFGGAEESGTLTLECHGAPPRMAGVVSQFLPVTFGHVSGGAGVHVSDMPFYRPQLHAVQWASMDVPGGKGLICLEVATYGTNAGLMTVDTPDDRVPYILNGHPLDVQWSGGPGVYGVEFDFAGRDGQVTGALVSWTEPE